MANIKLPNDNWETSGIYDIDQSKTQRVLNASFVSDISDLNGAINAIKPYLNILVVGNSFDQDVFAYLPPILIEAMPEYELNFCILYESSADFATHNQMFVNDSKYTWANVWNNGDTAWTRINYADTNGMTLKTALQYKRWDMVFMQATTADVQTDALIQSNVIDNGRKLMRAIQANAIAPFNFYYVEWLARGTTEVEINNNYQIIHDSIFKTVDALGFSDYVPIGTAIQNARTNSTLKTYGEGISMLYSDNIHIQGGLGALICTYVLAAFILQKCGKPNGINASSFQPSTANVEAINAKPVGQPVGMTHGDTPSGSMTVVNKRAAMEIAYLTINNPHKIIDCSDIRQTVPS